MRALVPIAVVAIVAVAVVILVLTDRRRTRRNRDFAQINKDLHRARGTINQVSKEVQLQLLANHVDLSAIESILREHNNYTYGEDRL